MFIKNVFYTFSTEVVSVGATFLMGVVLARALSPADRGAIALIMTLPWIVVSFANLGLPQANIYFIGREKRSAERVLGNAIIVALLMGAVSLLVLRLLKDNLLASALDRMPPQYWIPFIVLIPFLLIDMNLLSIMRAEQRFDLFNLRRVVTSVTLLVGFVIALVIRNGGLAGGVITYIAITLAMVIFSFVLVRRIVPIRLYADPKLTADSLQFGVKSYLQNLMGTLNYRLDLYLLAFFLDPAQVAFYVVATSLAEIAFYMPNSVGVVLFPRLSNASLEDVHAITAKVCRNTLAITGVVVLLLFAFGWILLPLVYGAEYKASIIPLIILLPGVLAMCVYKVLTRNFTSRNRQQISIMAGGAALIINVLLNLILIPRLGVAGAAVASSVSYTIAGLALLLLILRETDLSWRAFLIPEWRELRGHLEWLKVGISNKVRKVRT